MNLPEVPRYLVRQHYVKDLPFDIVFSEVGEKLGEIGADFEFRSEKYEIEGRLSGVNGSCGFKVSFFKGVTVELMRSFGSRDTYLDIYMKLIGIEKVSRVMPLANVIDSQGADMLLDLFQNKYKGCQKEALDAMCSYLESEGSETNRDLILERFSPEKIISFLEDSNSEYQTSGVRFLKLMNFGQTKSLLSRSHAVKVILEERDSYMNAELKRTLRKLLE